MVSNSFAQNRSWLCRLGSAQGVEDDCEPCKDAWFEVVRFG